MSDDDINTSTNQALRDYMDGLPGPASYKDEHHVFQYVNSAYGKLVGLPQHLDIVGRTAFDLPCGAAAYAEAFQEQDRQVMRSGKSYKVLDTHPFAGGEMRVLVNRKIPWFDEKKNVVGTLLKSIDITNAYIVGISTQLALYTGNIRIALR